MHNNYKFLFTPCNKGICYKNIQKCSYINGYIFNDNDIDNRINRKTYKCVVSPDSKYKLMTLDNIFVPSIMNDTFCDILYTVYYDYNDFTVLKNRIYNLNLPLAKCIRIRKYHFQPGTFFEIKYTGGTKIRTLIDDKYNILEPEKLEPEYSDIIIHILKQIKEQSIKPLFTNTYKRMSFIYKNNPSIRITFDSNIEFFYNNIYKLMDNDVIEFKIPNNIGIEQTNLYIDEISKLSNIPLKYSHFSKFEYYYYNVIQSNKYI